MVSTPYGYNSPREGLLQYVSIVWEDLEKTLKLVSDDKFDLLADPRVLVERWVRKSDGALGLSHL